MSMVISASSLTRRAYTGNTNFKSDTYRENSSNHDVVNADRKALLRMLDKLEDLDFDSTDSDDTKSIYNTVIAYLDVYNNAVSSTLDSSSSEIVRTGKQIKNLMKEYSSELSDIGITFKSDGTVKVDKTALKKATTSQVSKIFGNSDYTSEMKKLIKKLRNQVNRETPQQEITENETSQTETDGSTLNLYV